MFPLRDNIPSRTFPLAMCSSSGVMGHSRSFGKADLVTVAAKKASLADAAATALCNRIQSADDIQEVLEEAQRITGLEGVLIAVEDKVGMVGDLPEVVRQGDSGADGKITRS